MNTLLVTGGAGFIGSNYARLALERHPYTVVVFDKLTYAGRPETLRDLERHPRFRFERGDIADAAAVRRAIETHRVDAIVNFAAETHVDRSIHDPVQFTVTNELGTHVLLDAARALGVPRFHHVSTDEVYGHVEGEHRSTERDPLVPRSPYAASKAASDLMVNAYHVTYGLFTTITRGANSVGPYQYPEKVVPLFTTNALRGLPLPVYGDGRQMREYSHVMDHCDGIDLVLHHGQSGEAYNVGAVAELENIRMTEIILEETGAPASLVRHVTDRAGHDRRYAMDVSKVMALGWRPRFTPEEAIRDAARWYVNNRWWWEPIRDGEFEAYYRRQYGERLGLS